MHIHKLVIDALQDKGEQVNVLVTCSRKPLEIEQALIDQGCVITHSIPEFLTIHATIMQPHLALLRELPGVAGVELLMDSS